MAAPAGCRFSGPIALVLFGPLAFFGSAAEPIRDAADTEVIARKSRDPASSPAAKAKDTSVYGEGSAEELVRAALKAEAAGDAAEREKLLRKALEKDPNCAPARWHLGYVRSGKEWVKWDELQRRAASDPRIAEYRRRFDELAGTAAGELALARWCRDQGLEDHAKTHWGRLLSFDPQNEEALKALGLRWHQGQLMTHEQIVAARRARGTEPADATNPQGVRKDWNKHWAPRVTKWQRMVHAGNAAIDSVIGEELKSASDTDLFLAIRSLTAILMARSQGKKDEADYQTLSLKWIAVLDGMQEHPATLALAWQAVDHPMPEVRAAAADALKKRPKDTYVPILLAGMQSPVEVGFSIQPLFGSVTWQHTFYQEGHAADVSVTRVGSFVAAYMGPNLQDSTYPWGQDSARDQRFRDRRARVVGDANRKAAGLSAQAAAQATLAARRVQGIVTATNARIEELNARIRSALTRATGTDAGDSPTAWYKWWKDCQYTKYDVEKPALDAEKKPIWEYSSTKVARVEFHMPTIGTGPGGSCFPRGTIVWTLTGPAVIEKIQVADRVLSQHPVTGELAYKPVIQTTTRKAESWARISLGGEVITATRGHAFLVAGEGWKMAKELTVGMRLHTPSGSVMVDGLQDVSDLKPFYERLAERPDASASDDLAYNLVVDESHTYFVGQRRVLVFDNLFAALANQPPTATALAK